MTRVTSLPNGWGRKDLLIAPTRPGAETSRAIYDVLMMAVNHGSAKARTSADVAGTRGADNLRDLNVPVIHLGSKARYGVWQKSMCDFTLSLRRRHYE